MGKELSREEIQDLIPHRDPFMFVDKILDYELGKQITALVKITNEQPYFHGHFPGNPIMPGVIQIEALAQAATVLAVMTQRADGTRENGVLLFGLDNVKFRKPVMPNDELIMKIEVVRRKGKIYQLSGKNYVNNEVVSEAKILASLT